MRLFKITAVMAAASLMIESTLIDVLTEAMTPVPSWCGDRGDFLILVRAVAYLAAAYVAIFDNDFPMSGNT